MKKSWYIIRHRYGQSERAIMNLGRLNIRFFIPRAAVELVGKHRLLQGECLFPPYIFIELDPEDVPISSIQNMPGVSGFVRFGKTLAQVPERIMESLFDQELQSHSQCSEAILKIMQCADRTQRMIMFLSMMQCVNYHEEEVALDFCH